MLAAKKRERKWADEDDDDDSVECRKKERVFAASLPACLPVLLPPGPEWPLMIEAICSVRHKTTQRHVLSESELSQASPWGFGHF